MKPASCCLAAAALLALPTADLVAQSEGATKSNVVTTTTGHPEKAIRRGGSSHQQAKARAESRENCQSYQRKLELGARRLLLGW